MGQFTVRTYEEILERAINRVVARTTLTDINDGSSLKQLLAAWAREADELYFQAANFLDLFDIYKAVGNDLDERAKEFNPNLISRDPARRATGSVVFARAGIVGTISIPIGTQVQVPADGAQPAIIFETTIDGQILNGFTTSAPVDITALVAGAAGNADSGTIIGFTSKPSGVDTVTNPSALTNGRDLESDDSLRNRLVNHIKGLARSHVLGIETAALSAEDVLTGKRVVFAQVVEDFVNLGNVTVYIDDGGGTAKTTTAVVGGTILAAATGGERIVQLPNWPIDESAAFVVRRTAGTGGSPSGEPTGILVMGTDYTLNPASGQINLLQASFPNGLIGGAPGDAIDGDWTYYTGLVAECQKIIDGDPADRANYPGYRAAGVLIKVQTPTIDQQVIRVNITVAAGFDQTVAASSVAVALSAYVNGLGIGEDVILNEMRERTMGVAGIYDCEFLTPTENVAIVDGHMARVQAANITVS
jgi:uncharacterized phage protein gp47/JayE